MLSIIANALRIATFTDRWNAPDHWIDRAPRSRFEAERLEEDRKRIYFHHRGIW